MQRIAKYLFATTCFFYLMQFMMPLNIYAGNYFIDCNIALERKEFKPLRDYYNSNSSAWPRILLEYQEENPNVWPPDKCFRLNKNEYLVTINSFVAPIVQGLYYFNSTDNTYELYNDKQTTCFPGVAIAEEFVGKNNKRYVLMVGGITGSVFYKIFNLIERKDENSYPFLTYHIISDHWEPVNGLCGPGEGYSEPIATEILSYKILNQGTDKVEIIFKILEQDCRTKVKRTYEKIFHIKDGIFTADQ